MKEEKKNSSSYHNFIKAFFQTFFFFHPLIYIQTQKRQNVLKFIVSHCIIHSNPIIHTAHINSHCLEILYKYFFYTWNSCLFFVLNENEDAWVIYGSLLGFSFLCMENVKMILLNMFLALDIVKKKDDMENF